ncbi:CDP-glycerol glycerophosphotransferase family protein [Rhizobium sp. ARZ01]|uniref:CDP-glycerol glycerophosphotransferase family protein n=1 Tax=Rhizobium sp. ARZ01 TaxID=2769313 RepID=UPI00178065D3|nr:CDP-glycerol glycerophosphotransferase family protein [Rhizobium sp. ARZ01]MBD9373984.1 CDP-glycerol glycerophosphotransferase family protein [Rhizobium sp. ARZ01]
MLKPIAARLKEFYLRNKNTQAGQAVTKSAKIAAQFVDKLHAPFVTIFPSSAAVHHSRGRWQARLWQTAAAVSALEKASQLNANDAQVWELLARLYDKQRRPWLQLQAMQNAVASGKATAYRLHRLAVVAQKMNRPEEAIEAYEAALSKLPGKSVWRCEFGLLLASVGKFDAAIEQYRLAEKESDDSNVRRFGVGHLHQKAQRWSDAASAYRERALTSKPDAELYYRTGQAYDYSYQWDDAAHWYHKAIELESEPHWPARLGYINERRQNFEEAATFYRKALELRDDSGWRFRLGVVLAAQSDWIGAATELLKSLHCNTLPNWFTAPSNAIPPKVLHDFSVSGLQATGSSAITKEDWPTAVAAYRYLIDRSNGHDVNNYATLGYALIRSGDLPSGVGALIEARVDAENYGMDHAIFRRSKDRHELEDYSYMRSSLPIQAKTIVYESFGGSSMSCNPLAIFKYVLGNLAFADWKHVWAVNDATAVPQEFRNRCNVIIVEKESDAYRRYLATASHLINNSTFPYWFTRRPDQKYLNTWHGTPLKTLGIKMNGRFLEHANGARNFLQASHLITPNSHTTASTRDDFGVKGLVEHKLRESGYPRADLTLSASIEQKALTRKLLNVEGDKPILFYAPTWRGTHKKIKVDLARIKRDLAALKDCGYAIVFRGHSMMQKALSDKELGVTIAPASLDTNEILAVTDVLVTDYSSVFFEFIPLRKPIFYYAYDYEEYTRDRGFYLDIHDMPGQVVHTVEELTSSVKALGSGKDFYEANKAAYEKAIAAYCADDDGHASERVAEFFFKESPDPIATKRTLFYAGPFMANGITSSFINLAEALNLPGSVNYLALDPGSVAREQKRLDEVTKLPGNVQILGRVGIMPMSPEERWLVNKALTMETITSPRISSIVNRAHSNEFQRIFGDTQFETVVHFEGYNYFWSMLLANSGAAKKIAYLHNDMYQEWYTKNPPLRYLFRSYKDFDAIVSVSDTLRDHNRSVMSPAFDLDPDKFVASPNLVSSEKIVARSNAPLDEDLRPWFECGIVLTTVGRLSPEKDHLKLVSAFSRIAGEFPDAKLVIIGDGPLRSTLDHAVSDARMADRILLAGHRQNAFPAMKQSTCFVLPSNHEGQPMVLLEAMVLNIPIVATDIPGNRGVLHEDYGLIVPNSEEGLVEGLRKVLTKEIDAKGNFDPVAYRDDAIGRFTTLTKAHGRAEPPAGGLAVSADRK